MRYSAYLTAPLLLLVAGCSAPSGQPPAAPPPAPSLPLADGESLASPFPSAWWTLFGDPELNRLIDRARQNNRNLALASARIEAAQARARLAGADAALHATGAASASRSRSSANTSASDYLPAYQNRFGASLQFAYEADVWGRIRALREAAQKSVEVSAADRAAAELTLCAELARAHLSRLGIRRELRLLDRQLEAYADTERLQTVRAESGFATDLEVARTRVEAANREGERAALRERDQALANAIALLCGDSAGLGSDSGAEPTSAATAPELPAVLPLALLMRRPDVAAVRAKWESAAQRVYAARVARYPSLSLTGKIGAESERLEDLIDWRSRLWSMAGGLSAPLLDGGSLKASLEIEQAALKEAAAAYEAAVLTAYREVADALAAGAAVAERTRAADRAIEAASRAHALAQTRYASGFATYLDVIDTQRSLLAAERTRTQLDTARQTAAVDLIRALGPP